MGRATGILAIIVATMGAGLLVPGVATGADTYTSCDVLVNRPDRARSCVKSDRIGGVFIAKQRAEVRYNLNIWHPGVPREIYHYWKRTGPAGEPSVVRAINKGFPRTGRYKFVWRSGPRRPGGRVVDKDRLRMTRSPAAPRTP